MQRTHRARRRTGHEPIIGGGAGTGISAKCEEAAGIDLIVIYNSGSFRQAIEKTGINFAAEVDMIRQAHELDLFTTPYVFSADEAVAMTRAGADFIVPHMGVTVGGTIGASSAKALAQSVQLIAMSVV